MWKKSSKTTTVAVRVTKAMLLLGTAELQEHLWFLSVKLLKTIEALT